MCGQPNLRMSPNHLRTSGRPDNISWDSWVTRHRHLCRCFQMVIPRVDLSMLDSKDCIIIVPSTWGLHTVGKNNGESHHGFEPQKNTHFSTHFHAHSFPPLPPEWSNYEVLFAFLYNIWWWCVCMMPLFWNMRAFLLVQALLIMWKIWTGDKTVVFRDKVCNTSAVWRLRSDSKFPGEIHEVTSLFKR